MKYLITGITGFAGPHLAKLLLSEGHSVAGLIRHSNGRQADLLDVISAADLERVEFLVGDLTNSRMLREVFHRHRFDGVFHLAAQSHPPTSFKDPVGTFETNVTGTINLAQAIEDYQPDCRIMFCSTSEVYGDSGRAGQSLKSSQPLHPSNPYGTSKAAMDLYFQERFANHKLRGFITRAFSHTGPRRGRTFSISCDAYQLARMMAGDAGRILRVGNLKTVRVVMDVRDTVRAYYLLMRSDGSEGNVYNVCGSVPHKMEHYTDILITLSQLSGVEKQIDPELFRPVDIQCQIGDCSMLVDLTGWQTRHNLESTLGDLLQYWLKKLG